MLLNFRKPPYVILDSATSWSGKYWCFYSHHYHTGKLCYVFGNSNKETGELITRHYNEDSNQLLDPNAIKALARTEWEKFKQSMTARKGEEEKDEFQRDLKPWLSRPDNTRKRS